MEHSLASGEPPAYHLNSYLHYFPAAKQRASDRVRMEPYSKNDQADQSIFSPTVHFVVKSVVNVFPKFSWAT